jgi:hypothetical protein
MRKAGIMNSGVSIPKRETKHRVIERRHYNNDLTSPNNWRHLDPKTLVKELQSIKRDCRTEKFDGYGRKENMFIARFQTTKERTIRITADEDNYFEFGVFPHKPVDFEIDIWRLVRILRLYKGIVIIYATDNQLVIAQGRNISRLNFHGVKENA